MTKLTMGLCCACLVMMGTLGAAQSADKANAPTANDTKVTGCLGEGPYAGNFILTAIPTTSQPAGNDMKDVKSTSYEVVWDKNLGPHNNQKVEITGAVRKKGANRAKGTGGDTSATETTLDELRTLEVKSLRVISSTCK